MQPMDDRIGRIEEAKKRQGLTIRQLADMSGISKSTVSRVLSGATDPTEYTISKLEEALGVGEELVDPILDMVDDNPRIKRYLMIYEDRYRRMRATHNMIVADKDRSLRNAMVIIILLTVLCMALVAFDCYLLYDVTRPDWGLIR